MTALLQFWLPVKCVLCGSPSNSLCKSCQSSFPLRPHRVSRGIEGFATCDYQGPALDLVHAFKRGGSNALAGFLAKPMAELIAQQLLAHSHWQANTTLRLVPVPSRPDSFRRRGFVPATLLARAIARELKHSQAVSAFSVSLVRLNRKVRDQAALNLKEREQNLNHAMSSAPFGGSQELSGDDSKRRVVMVDDVVTTGATLREMRRALSEAGWNPIFFVAFAETL